MRCIPYLNVFVPNHVCLNANDKSCYNQNADHFNRSENPTPIQLPERGLGLHHTAPVPRTEHVAELFRLLIHAGLVGGAVAIFGRDFAGSQTSDAEREQVTRAIGRTNLPTCGQVMHPLLEGAKHALVERASAGGQELLAISGVRSGKVGARGRVGEAEISSCAYYTDYYYRDCKPINNEN